MYAIATIRPRALGTAGIKHPSARSIVSQQAANALVDRAMSLVGFGAHADSPRMRREGQLLRDMVEGLDDWSGLFVYCAGLWSQADERTGGQPWPLPRARSHDLARYGAVHELFTVEPEPGDVFVQHSAATDSFIRSGIVVGVVGRGRLYSTGHAYVQCDVVEGNSSETGELGGSEVVVVRRRLVVGGRDRVLRWRELVAVCDAEDRRAA